MIICRVLLKYPAYSVIQKFLLNNHKVSRSPHVSNIDNFTTCDKVHHSVVCECLNTWNPVNLKYFYIQTLRTTQKKNVECNTLVLLLTKQTSSGRKTAKVIAGKRHVCLTYPKNYSLIFCHLRKFWKKLKFW